MRYDLRLNLSARSWSQLQIDRYQLHLVFEYRLYRLRSCIRLHFIII